MIAYCEANITITYNRPESEVRSIYSAQTQKSILDCVVDALDRQRTQFAIQISTSTLETDDVAALVRSVDEHAFVIVSEAKEVFGRGFGNIYGDD